MPLKSLAGGGEGGVQRPGEGRRAGGRNAGTVGGLGSAVMEREGQKAHHRGGGGGTSLPAEAVGCVEYPPSVSRPILRRAGRRGKGEHHCDISGFLSQGGGGGGVPHSAVAPDRTGPRCIAHPAAAPGLDTRALPSVRTPVPISSISPISPICILSPRSAIRSPRRAATLPSPHPPIFVALVQLLRQYAHVVEVDVEQLLEPRPLHLDHHLLAAEQNRAMDLPGGGGGAGGVRVGDEGGKIENVQNKITYRRIAGNHQRSMYPRSVTSV
jgi:hypothetical protein